MQRDGDTLSGNAYRLHTGGVDNIFPHHENEIAQSEGALGERWVAYWVHAQHLLTDGLKMAKSTSNAYRLDEIIARGFEPLALRFLFATAHYRTRLNFTFTALKRPKPAFIVCAWRHNASAIEATGA